MSIKRRGLGQGLSALMGEDLESSIRVEQNKDVYQVDIASVEPNPDQPRQSFNEDALQELADSIRQYGVLQPLLVNKKNGYYEIIAGERRWRAARLAGLKELPVLVKDFEKEQALEVSLIENIQRSNLNPVEEAQAYQRLLDEFHLKQDDVAEKVSKSRSAIANTLRLLQLDKRVQKMIVDEMITSGHARALLGIKDPDLQVEIAAKVFDEKLSVRETEELMAAMQKREEKAKQKSPRRLLQENLKIQLQAYEEEISQALGTRASIKARTPQKGKIEIEYLSAEEFERIVELIKGVEA
ncbi:ParB/RepB/Spo0J family partition protein [Anaerotalea alkaliphila]|uniref:ParB/RepB/Spo0J family partition protein n=1 Tax=Anaerotalea alkaliphila TaxID=2662126 RepID=A0A7X5HWV5_9FIRM|nr:ParB/RepB/Spo0J family partition protein [Anaerotalea alkaliphila]NDL68078.1 ParB/RepB/Spo0J family partition protein [Anaerotalea alkaliphila]